MYGEVKESVAHLFLVNCPTRWTARILETDMKALNIDRTKRVCNIHLQPFFLVHFNWTDRLSQSCPVHRKRNTRYHSHNLSHPSPSRFSSACSPPPLGSTVSRRFSWRFEGEKMSKVCRPTSDSISDMDDFPFPWLRLPEDLDRQLDRYLIAIRQKRDATGVVCLAIALQLIDNREKFSSLSIRPDSPLMPQFNIPAVGHSPEITVGFNAAAIEAIPAAYGVARKHFYSLVLQAYPVAWKWIVQLTACSQVHPLQIKDVTNYFNQFPDFKKITSFNGYDVDSSAVLPYIKFTAPGIKWPQSDRGHKLVANDEIRAVFLSDSFFVKHHTTFSPTAEICRQLIDGLGCYVSEFEIDAKMIETVDEALANYWDRSFNAKIPVQLRAMAAAYAEFQGRDYGNWTEGKRALSETNPILIEIWKDMFKIY